MPSPLLKPFILLALLLLASRSQSITFELGDVDAWVPSGNYRIYSCSSRVPDVKNALDSAYLYLQSVLLGTSSPTYKASYKAFFHSANPAPILNVLQSIVVGTNVMSSQFGSQRPTIACANEADPGLREVWDQCQSEHVVTQRYSGGNFIVFLCPRFFSYFLSPQSGDCGIINHMQTGFLKLARLADTQYSLLVAALADMYIQDTMHTKRTHVRDVNECLALPPDLAVKNPFSYSVFVSSTFVSSSPSPFATISISLVTILKRNTLRRIPPI